MNGEYFALARFLVGFSDTSFNEHVISSLIHFVIIRCFVCLNGKFTVVLYCLQILVHSFLESIGLVLQLDVLDQVHHAFFKFFKIVDCR